MRKFYSFVLILSTMLCGFTSRAWGASPLTVASGSTTSNYVPISGNYCDVVGTRTQVIYPSTSLTEMADKEITALKFYSSQSSVSFSGVVIKIRLAEVNVTTLSGFLSPDFTEVYSGGIAISSYEMNFTLSDAYLYGGGNLLLETEVVTAGTYNFPYFYGISSTSAAYGNKVYYGSAGVSSFIPKTSFTYATPVVTACPKPKSLAGVAASSSSATITWKKGGSETAWNLQYSSNNGVSWTTLNLTTSNVSVSGENCTYTLTGLSAQTTYKVQVRANCGGDDGESAYTSAISFTTLCGSISSFPWTETFEGATADAVMPCWDNSASTASEISTYPERIWGVYSYSSNKMLRMYNYYVHSGTALINTPTIDLPAAPKLTFKYAHNASCGTCYVKISTNGGSTFTNIGNFSKGSGSSYSAPGTFTTKTIDLSTYSNQSVIIQFYASANYGDGAIFIDDVHIESTQNCSKPATPTDSDLTGSSATLSWTANEGVTDYKYINVDRTANPTYVLDWANDATSISATSVNLTGLTDGHDYEFYVMCACGSVASDACSYTPLSCPVVTGVTFSNKVYNGVTVNWTTSASTNCDVQYKAGSGSWNSAGTNISGTTKTITGLTVGTTYTIQVKPNCSADGWVAAGETYTPSCPTPGALTLSAKKYNGVTVSWSAITGISTYNLRYRKGSDTWTTINDINALTYTISSGLVTNQEYTIELQTECEGSWSSTTYTPIAEAPTVVSANSITETSISAVCTDMSGSGATSHQYILVARDAAEDWSGAKNLTTTGTSVTGLTLGTDYDLYARAVYPGSIYSAGTKKQFTTAVNKPTGLTKGTVTSSSAQFSWTAGGGATQYQYLCLPSGTTPNETHWSSSTLTTLTSVTAEGLSANTSYIFHVRAYYNGKTSARVYSSAFTTPCGTEDLPFSESVTSGTKPACWTISNWASATANYWYTYNDYGYNSTYALRYYAKTYTSNYAEATTPPIYISDKCDLSFYIKNNYSYGYVPCQVFVNDVDANTTTEITSSLDISKSISSITQKICDLSSYKGKNITITFKGKGIGTSYTAYLWIDEIKITAKACTTPTAGTPTVTYNSATITWTDSRAEEWSVRYRTYNVGDWTVVNNLTSKTYTMTGLTTDTEYEVQVRNDCSATSSSWTASKRFTPTCKAPTGLTFSSPTADGGHVAWTAAGSGVTTYQYCIVARDAAANWAGAPTTTNTYVDLTGLTAGNAYTFYVRSVCASGVYCDAVSCDVDPACPTPSGVTFSNKTYNSATVTWTAGGGETSWNLQVKAGDGEYGSSIVKTTCSHSLTSLTAGTTYTVRVQASCEGEWTSNTFTPEYSVPTSLNVTSITDVTASASWGEVADCDGYDYVVMASSAAADWSGKTHITGKANHSASLSGLTPGTAYTLYVRATYGANAGDATSKAFSTVYMKPTGLTKGTVTANSAVYSWSAGGTETRYQWAVKASGTPSAGDWTLLGSGVRTATATGLTDATNYTFYVRSYYGDGQYSDYVSSAFTTLCGVKALEYGVDFNSGLPACWSLTNGSGTGWAPYSYTDATGSYCMRYSAAGTSGYNELLESPSISITEKAVLTFVHKTSATAPTFKVLASKNGGSTKTELQTYSATTTKTTQTIDLSSYMGETIIIYFQGTSSKTGSRFVYIDDAQVSYKPCSTPTSLAAVATTDGAIVTWSHDEADGHYDLRYRVYKSTTPYNEWIEVNNLSTKSHTLTGLTLGTKYDVQVRANCSAHRISSWTSTVNFTPACNAPTAMTKTAETYNSVSLSWTGDAKALRYIKTGDADWTKINFSPAKTSHTLSSLATGEVYTVQVQADCDDGDTKWSSAFNFTPTCVTPSGVTVSSITQTSASVNWTVNSGESEWNIQYKKEGDADWTTKAAVTTRPYSLTGLSHSSAYQVRVAATCSGVYSSAAEFNTLCGNQSLPFTEDFNGLTSGIPYCWDNAEGTADEEDRWTYTTSAHEGKAVRFNSGWDCAEGETNFLKTPTIAISEAATVEFWYHNPYGGDLSVYYSIDGGAKTLLTGASGLTAQSTWRKKYFNLPAACVGHNVVVMFKATSNASIKDDCYISIDDVRVYPTPTCLAPLDPTATSIGIHDATITWTNDGSETSYQYVCVPTGDTPNWGSATKVNSRTATVEGLTGSTTYDFYVRSWCAADDQSESSSVTFTTECDHVNIGWREDFEHSGSLPACWDDSRYTYWGASYIWHADGSEHKSGSYAMMVRANKYATSSTADLETPTISITDKADLRYYWYSTGVPYKVIMKVNGKETELASKTGSHDWASVEVVNIPDTCRGKIISLIFRAQGAGTSYNYYLYIDSLSVQYRPCHVPTSLAISDTTNNEARATWNHDEADGHWDIRYRVYKTAAPYEEWIEVDGLDEKEYMLTGLTRNTKYEVQVRAHCSEHRISAWTASNIFKAKNYVAKVSAEGVPNSYYMGVDAAIEAANSLTDPTVTMLRDTSVASEVEITAAMTLDLNGATISSEETTADKGVFKINASGETVTITDSDTGGKIDHTANCAGYLHGINLVAGTLNLESGTIYAENTYSTAGSSYRAYGIFYKTSNAASITISSGTTIEAKCTKDYAYGIYIWINSASCPLTMTGGEVIASGTEYVRGIYTQGTAELSDVTVSASSSGSKDCYAVFSDLNGVFTINNGSYTATCTGSGAAYPIAATKAGSATYGGKFTINGGRFSGKSKEVYVAGNGSVTLQGGVYVHNTDLAANCAPYYVVEPLTSGEDYAAGYRYQVVQDFTNTFTDGTGDHVWSTIGNWSKGLLPNINVDITINKPCVVDVDDAQAKSVVLDQSSTNTGSLQISAGKELVVAETLRKTTDGSNRLATGENDLVFASTSAAGLGALVMGEHNGTNKATVNFYTKSTGKKNETSVAQYVGTPFNDETNILYNWYNSWVYKIIYDGSGNIGWELMHEGDGMTPFKGYCVFSADAWGNDAGHTYWMQGTLVSSENHTCSGLNWESGSGAANGNNENLLANSWMAPIKIKAMQTTDFVNADATIYIFKSTDSTSYLEEGFEGNYSTATIGTCEETDLIPAMQSFSVFTTGNTASVTLDYNRIVYAPAVAGTTPIANKAPKRAGASEYEADKMRLFVRTEDGYGDMLYMWERADFTEGFENGWDGRKLFGESYAPQLYAITPDGEMAVNCVPTFEGTVLGFRKGTEDDVYTFTFEYEGENTWYLNDLREQTSTLINSESTYMFMASDEDMAARFIISATPIHHVATGIDLSAGRGQQSAVRKIVINDHVFIIRNGQMYDVTGVTVK